MRLFPRMLFLTLPHLDHRHRFLPGLMQYQGGAVLSIEVHHHERRRGRSSCAVLQRSGTGIIDRPGEFRVCCRVHPEAAETGEA